MISRRNIRVKVMQTLYELESNPSSVPVEKTLKQLNNQFEESRQLFTYLVYFISEIARYAETDSLKRASKHLPSEQDLRVNTKISGNTILWQILEDPEFKAAIADTRIRQVADTEMIRKVYLLLTASEEYNAYINLPSRDKKDEKDILVFIFSNLMLPNEDFISHIEEFFVHWDDDADMMNQMILNFLQKPANYNFKDIISREKREFGLGLLHTSIEKKDYCMELIKPKLKNWDADRIAILDMILMRMGVCELLYFETIPTKVSINEYIDLAKEYSTPQSGQFVNGILDSIHKEEEQTGQLKKVDYKKQ